MGLIIFFSAVLLGVSSLTIVFYSKTVNTQQDIAALTQSVQAEQVQNAELKDQLYKTTDPTNLENLAVKEGFVKVVNPQWAFVSRS